MSGAIQIWVSIRRHFALTRSSLMYIYDSREANQRYSKLFAQRYDSIMTDEQLGGFVLIYKYTSSCSRVRLHSTLLMQLEQ